MNFHSSSFNPVSSHTDVFFSVLTKQGIELIVKDIALRVVLILRFTLLLTTC